MKKIRIIAVPPGFAPLAIREQWLGVEIPLATEEEVGGFGTTYRVGSSGEGYRTTTDAAINALKDAGKESAYEYWKGVRNATGVMLVFRKDCCMLLE